MILKGAGSQDTPHAETHYSSYYTYLILLFISDSQLINICDGSSHIQLIDKNEEGFLLYSGPGFPSGNQNVKDTEKPCSTLLTPIHGQFLQFDLIPLEEETDRTHPKPQPCIHSSTLQFTAEPMSSPTPIPNSPSAVITKNLILKQCTNSPLTQDNVLLSKSLFSNVTISLKPKDINTTGDVILLHYKGKY